MEEVEIIEESIKADLSLDEIVSKVRAALMPELTGSINMIAKRVDNIEEEL